MPPGAYMTIKTNTPQAIPAPSTSKVSPRCIRAQSVKAYCVVP